MSWSGASATSVPAALQFGCELQLFEERVDEQVLPYMAMVAVVIAINSCVQEAGEANSSGENSDEVVNTQPADLETTTGHRTVKLDASTVEFDPADEKPAVIESEESSENVADVGKENDSSSEETP